ncbi:CAP domain-containing protein [Paenarthrobacter aurescens]|uniref:CAP domain-containing protein n=1 Tax=Paenarthrobacter aurescens TaxID=43663 RepID=UPI001FE24831|nr:CAP domain-containing protein [Paenarthrobacter aurescens]MDO6145102.1 CAP domain-containing protein [Paenarthrobacter aurescens]MDO6148947.1 CAP domain-containing protein [Paenarthrobacter aurescens]MDO6160193.1 CAP domain-containing protein [Paenarthrobacter aurescens]MDO6164052.1 CAP domain-containing protein [Paenarthrobacter aurescens]
MRKLAAPAAIVLACTLALGVAASSQILPSTQTIPGPTATPSANAPSALTAPTETSTAEPAPSAPLPAAGTASQPTFEPAPDSGTSEPTPDASTSEGSNGGPVAVDPVFETPPPLPSIGPSWGPDNPSDPGASGPPATEPNPQTTAGSVPSEAPPSAPAAGPDPSDSQDNTGSSTEPAEPTMPSSPAPSEPAATQPAPSQPAPSEPAASEPAPSEPVTSPPPPTASDPAPATPFPGKTPSGDINPDNGALALLPDSNTAAILTVFNAINSYRASLGLAPVKYHATVASLAQDWSNNIATREVIQHRANFWTDPRALNPNNGAGEVIAVRWDRDAAQLVEWWKGSPGHDALLRDPRFNVMGIGITYTDGNWQTTPNRFTLWGVVNFFGYTSLPAGTTTSPGGTVPPPTDPVAVCEPGSKHQPPTLNLSAASISSAADLVSIAGDGSVVAYPSWGGGRYGGGKRIGLGFTGLKDLFVTDWDRDGVFDLISQRLDGALLLYPGLQGGGFKDPVALGQGWGTLNIAVGTWCANNRLPQIVAMDAGGNLYLYKNAGPAYIRSQAAIGPGFPAIRISMVDYNADGFQDLLTTEANGTLRLYRGSGLGTPKQESRPVVGAEWTDYTGLRALRGVTGADSTGIAGLNRSGFVEYWDLNTGRLTTPVTIGNGWGGLKFAQ